MGGKSSKNNRIPSAESRYAAGDGLQRTAGGVVVSSTKNCDIIRTPCKYFFSIMPTFLLSKKQYDDFVCIFPALSTFGQPGNSNKCKTLPQQLSFQKSRGESFDSGSNDFIRGSHGQVSTPSGGNSIGNSFQQQNYSVATMKGLGVSGACSSGRTLVALYDYNSRHGRDVDFRKGDVLEVINDRQAKLMYKSFVIIITNIRVINILELILCFPVILIGGTST